MRTILCLQYFRAADRHRQEEIDACLAHNLRHPAVHGAVIWLESGAPPLPSTSLPLEVRPLGRRLQFSDWLGLAAKSQDAILVLGNADISLESGFEALEQQLPQPEIALALTRQEPSEDGEGGGIEPHAHWRQDCWAIRSDAPIDASLLAAAALPLGRPGSDNRIAHVLWSHGFRLRNPASELRVLHHQRHRSASYDRSAERLFGACTYVHPCPAGGADSELEHVIWSRGPERSGSLRVQVEPRSGPGLVQPYRAADDPVHSPKAHAPDGRCLVALGMHRSGTSVLMGTLHEAGVHIGEVLNQSIEGNRRGLQEAAAILYMQENLLETNGGSWHNPPTTVSWGDLHRSVRDLFIESRAGLSLWGFKDPRTIFTLDGWLEALPHLEPVGIFRHPLAVAHSLRHRDGFPLEQGLAIWRAYNGRLLELHHRIHFPLLEFDADPNRVQQGLNTLLEILRLPANKQAQEGTFFDAALRRNDQNDTPLDDDTAMLLAALRDRSIIRNKHAISAYPNRAKDSLLVHATRLFPKDPGAEADQLSGFAARCDWVVLSDGQEPRLQLRRREGIASPRHVFLSLREPFAALTFFEEKVLPQIQGPFRLVSGSEDLSLPHQLDRCWQFFGEEERRRIGRILDDPRLIAWAAENLDQAFHPRLMPLPLGLTFPQGNGDAPLPIPRIPPQSCRPLRLLCAHRLREGPQGEERHRVQALCRRELAAWSTVLEQELPEPQYLRLLRTHAFVLCVAGGGLDPSPKAWQAMLHGTIPVMRSSALDGAYRELPVAIVEEWTAEALQPERLRAWQSRLAGLIDRPEGRAQTMERLGLEHWWQRIISFTPGEGAA